MTCPFCLEGSGAAASEDEIQWCFSQVKGTIEDEVTDGMFQELSCEFFIVRFAFPYVCLHGHAADIISTVQFNHDGEFLATGDKGGRVVIFQRDGTKMRVRGFLGEILTCGVPRWMVYIWDGAGNIHNPVTLLRQAWHYAGMCRENQFNVSGTMVIVAPSPSRQIFGVSYYIICP